MPELKIKKPLGTGVTRLVTDQCKYFKFSILRLRAGESFSEKLEGWECGVALLSGAVEAEVEGKKLGSMGPRRNVFEDLPWGLYVPGRFSYRLDATRDSEVALSYAPWVKAEQPILVTPQDLTLNQRGKPGYIREVRDIIVDRVTADSLLMGETVNRPGEWSSYPPHKHDTAIPGVETRLEEIYFYKVNPPQGFGFQRIYTDDRSLDVAVTVENDDLTILPRGYHPVAAAPGYSVYYFWVLAGEERKMTPHNDPVHEWVIK